MLATHKLRQTRTYLIKNRSGQARTLLVEHPVREQWRLVTPEKPAERSRDVYRFQVVIPAGKAHTLAVVEEQRRTDQIRLNGSDDTSLRFFLRHSVPSPALKASLERMIALKVTLTDTQRDLAQAQAQLKEITDDQSRIRANFEKMPPTSTAYKRYLEKFDNQETEIEKLQADIKAKQASTKAETRAYEDYVAGLNVEG
jgi:septal ring factor EnvC (AmiA/AmiB activator)